MLSHKRGMISLQGLAYLCRITPLKHTHTAREEKWMVKIIAIRRE